MLRRFKCHSVECPYISVRAAWGGPGCGQKCPACAASPVDCDSEQSSGSSVSSGSSNADRKKRRGFRGKARAGQNPVLQKWLPVLQPLPDLHRRPPERNRKRRGSQAREKMMRRSEILRRSAAFRGNSTLFGCAGVRVGMRRSELDAHEWIGPKSTARTLGVVSVLRASNSLQRWSSARADAGSGGHGGGRDTEWESAAARTNGRQAQARRYYPV